MTTHPSHHSPAQRHPAALHAPCPRRPVAARRPGCPLFPEWPQWSACCLLDHSRSCPASTLRVHNSSPTCNRVLTRPCAGTIATPNHSSHTRCRVRFEMRLLSAVQASATGWIRCGSSSAVMIDTVQLSPAAGRGWHVLHTTTICGAIFCARRWPRTRRPRLTPSPCSRTGSDALVGILVTAKEEPSAKRGHSDACASAGGVRTATLARAPRRPLHERSRASREGPPRAFGTGQTSSVLTSYILGPDVHASVTCVGFNNDPHSLICRKATRLVSPWHATRLLVAFRL